MGKDDFTRIPNGMQGVETRAVLLYTYGVGSGRLTPQQMCGVLSENPAKLYGLYPEKGSILEGSHADIAVLVDPEGDSIREIKPEVVVDAILAKRNLGTSRDMAGLTIGLGPGFSAGEDVDYVIETMRGHNLGRIIEEGPAMADTGVPGKIMGYGKERVIHAPAVGILYGQTEIAAQVKKDDVIAVIKDALCHQRLRR